ncbi:MAG TPA: NTP transferase domain-containing protein [Thermoanaerobaculia bacterium]|nr:NTP transferase domain-containing protein [Thermoanaerobaculia bacterium]
MIHGGILAAGEGSRLLRDGFAVPKPLVRVAGVTLVERAARNLLSAGAASLTVIFNESEGDCAEHLAAALADADADVHIFRKTTRSSLESLGDVLKRMPPGPALVSTVDAFCAREAFVSFAREARAFEGSTVLAVTPLVADENPLWVRWKSDAAISEIGGESGDVVTAGIYLFSERVRALEPPPELPRLRDFLRWLVLRGEPLYGVAISEVVDVDRGEDVELAEALARRMGER